MHPASVRPIFLGRKIVLIPAAKEAGCRACGQPACDHSDAEYVGIIPAREVQ